MNAAHLMARFMTQHALIGRCGDLRASCFALRVGVQHFCDVAEAVAPELAIAIIVVQDGTALI
jgi:hypothetical protein